ncbi:MAG: PqqD family protein [Candidatus Omnitrophota bacterium]
MNFLGRTPKKRDNLAWQIINGEAIVMILGASLLKHTDMEIFNETASRIWELIDGKRSVKNITAEIMREYDISFNNAHKEIMSFLQQMVKKDMIEIT